MILFKPEHVQLILDGHKTQTRRLGKRRWRIGAIHQCYTTPPWSTGKTASRPDPFAFVKVLAVREEKLEDISPADCLREGYADRREYLNAFHRINASSGDVERANVRVWVVDFELACAEP